MNQMSNNKFDNYDPFVADLALRGLRTIAFSFK